MIPAPLYEVELATAWRERAACHPNNLPEWASASDFFPMGETFDEDRPRRGLTREAWAAKRRAQAVCSECGVLPRCRLEAVDVAPTAGVWAGQLVTHKRRFGRNL